MALIVPMGGRGCVCATEQALIAAAEAANERIARCHEEVACPKCSAPVGERCVRMSAHHPGWAGRDETGGRPTTLKHPHRERWTQVVPAR